MLEQSPWSSLTIFSLLTVVICFFLFADLGRSYTLLLDSIINFGHVPLFTVVAGMALWALDRENWVRTMRKNYVKAFVISAALSLATETIQHFMPERSFQEGDIVNDLIGAGVFLLLAYQYRRKLPLRTRVAISTAAVFSLLTASLPVLGAAVDELRARWDYPLLGSFETHKEMERWKSEESYFERVRMHATQGKFSLEAILPTGLYPGITMDYPPRDWRGYDTLAFDAFLEEEYPLPLTIRINDLAHNEEYEDRYNRTFTLQPGPNQVAISLSEVEHAPQGRLMDMEHISILCLFSYKLHEPRTVYFDNFRLEKDS